MQIFPTKGTSTTIRIESNHSVAISSTRFFVLRTDRIYICVNRTKTTGYGKVAATAAASLYGARAHLCAGKDRLFSNAGCGFSAKEYYVGFLTLIVGLLLLYALLTKRTLLCTNCFAIFCLLLLCRIYLFCEVNAHHNISMKYMCL